MDFGSTSSENKPYWLDSMIKPLSFSKPDHDLKADIVIIGGGIAGITTGYFLAQEGKSVIILEAGFVGSGETGRSTAQLVTALDDKYSHLQKLWGPENVKKISASHLQAILDIEQIVQKHQIECLFERLDGHLFLHPSDDKQALQLEYHAASEAGLDVSLEKAVPDLPIKLCPCLVFHQQAQFHPLLYLTGLCQEILRHGGQIFTETRVDEINSSYVATSEGYKVYADHFVVATNNPFPSTLFPILNLKPFRTYVIGGLVKRYSLPKAMWWDTGDRNINPDYPPYHYVRLQPFDIQNDLLIVGGEDHEAEDFSDHLPEQPYSALFDWAQQYFNLDNVKYNWSGEVLQSPDSIGFIGRTPMGSDNIYFITGDSGTGITHATIAGRLISDLIAGRENIYEDLYKPTRHSWPSNTNMSRGISTVSV